MTQIILAGKMFEIKSLSPNKADKWREKVRQTLTDITNVGKTDESEVIQEGETPPVKVDNTTKIFEEVFNMATKAPEIIRELLFEYSPEINADRERLMEESNDEELTDAFIICARKSYPFGKLLSLAKSGFATT